MSNDDFEIQFNHESEQEFISQENIQVKIPAQVLNELESYARQDLVNEQGAILLGIWDDDGFQITLNIEAWIEAKYTDNQRANVTFTHETWTYVNKQHEANYPELKIVGWYHTHPGFGVFLSSYDRFIQENFFNEKWQIAMVTDPRMDSTGCFCWSNGEIKECDYHIIQKPFTTKPIEPKLPMPDNKPLPETKTLQKSPSYSSFNLWVVALVAILGVSVGVLLNPLAESVYNFLDRDSLLEQQLTNDNLSQELINDSVLNEVSSDSTPELEPAIEFTETVLDTLDGRIWGVLIVQTGDTLWKLMERTGSWAYEAEIVERNNLQDPSDIKSGTTIEFPIKISE